MRLLDTQTDERNRSECKENPCGKNEERIELLEGASERQQHGDGAKKDQRAAGSVKARVNAFRKIKENSVTGHCVRNARASQYNNMQCAESGDRHGKGERRSASGTGEGLHYI